MGPWSAAEKLTLAVLVTLVLVALGLLVRWDMSRECVRWATRIDSDGAGAYQTGVCAEYQPRRP